MDGYGGPVLLSADGRTLTVGGFSYPCFGTVQPVARETASRITVWLRYVAPREHGVCKLDMAMATAMRVHLTTPAGHRVIVDGASERRLAVFDGRQLLRPKAVPRGYRLQVVSPLIFAARSSASPQPPGASQEYLSRTATLTIVESPATLVLPQAGTPVLSVRVRGHAGTATAGAILWREQGLFILITATSADSRAVPLTAAALIALADSAPQVTAAASHG